MRGLGEVLDRNRVTVSLQYKPKVKVVRGFDAS